MSNHLIAHTVPQPEDDQPSRWIDMDALMQALGESEEAIQRYQLNRWVYSANWPYPTATMRPDATPPAETVVPPEDNGSYDI